MPIPQNKQSNIAKSIVLFFRGSSSELLPKKVGGLKIGPAKPSVKGRDFVASDEFVIGAEVRHDIVRRLAYDQCVAGSWAEVNAGCALICNLVFEQFGFHAASESDGVVEIRAVGSGKEVVLDKQA